MKNVKKYFTVIVVGFVIAMSIAVGTVFLVSNFNFNVTSEAGKEFDVNTVWKKDFKAPCTVAGDINTNEVGTYGCLVKVWGLIPMNVTVEVVDTTAPIVIMQAITVNFGEECTPESFVAQMLDKSEVTHQFVIAPDTTKLGTQVIQIVSTDKYNNSSTNETVLTVKGLIPSYTLEAGSELPPANVFVLEESWEASYITEIGKEMLNNIGEYPIQIQVQGVTEDVKLVVVDTTAPEIVTSIIKVDLNGSISYKKNIVVKDNCDDASDIVLEIDNSEVNLSAVGNYVVHCTATDKSGNKATKDLTVQVFETTEGGHTVAEVDALADKILASIINDSMTLRDKAYAIYTYTRNSIGYVNNSPKGDWLEAAYNGMVKKRGDCFTYAATAKYLLERIGLEPIVIQKEKEYWTAQTNHWWLILDIGEGYYHYDPTRRADGTTFFMWTDAQLLEYSNKRLGCHNFTRSKYPKIQ